VIEEVRVNRQWLASALESRGYRPLPSGANFLLIPVDNAAATVAGLRDRGVAIRPFADLVGMRQGARVSIGPRHELERFLEAWDETMSNRNQPGHTPEHSA